MYDRRLVGELVLRCEHDLDLQSANLSDEYGYGHLPLCVIDSVFSIGVRYEGVRNVIRRYCAFVGIAPTVGDSAEHTVKQMVRLIGDVDPETLADEVFQNRQRTSTRSGILKADAVQQFAMVLLEQGVNTIHDVSAIENHPGFESRIRRVPGQSSGISLRYFYMLAGADHLIKPDRMILRYLQRTIQSPISADSAQWLITEATWQLTTTYPSITPRLLDNLIWQFERSRG